MSINCARAAVEVRAISHEHTSIRAPDHAKIKQKMVFASSKDALRRALQGVAIEVQGTDYSEVAYESGTLPSF